MHHKVIKAQIRKQLKTRYLNWHRLTKTAFNDRKCLTDFSSSFTKFLCGEIFPKSAKISKNWKKRENFY
jgi:hypothetical protein